MAHALPIEDLPGVRVSNQYMVDVLTEARERLGLDVPLPDANFAAERVGVSERSYLDRGFETEDLAWAACEKLLPHIDRDRLKVILVSSVTYTRMVPSLASVLHERLKLGHDVVAFDSPLACHGFVGGFKVVEGLLQGHPPESQGLLVAAELMSRRVDAFDRQTSVIFGDGAGAALVENQGQGVGPVGWSTQGSKGPMIYFGTNPNPQRFWAEDGQLHIRIDPDCSQYLAMQGRQVFRDMVSTLPGRIQHELDLNSDRLEDYDYFVFHQANQRIVDLVAEKLSLPLEKVVNNIDRVGNTSSASIPIVVSEMVASGQLQRGQRVLMVGFGAGYSVGVSSMRW